MDGFSAPYRSEFRLENVSLYAFSVAHRTNLSPSDDLIKLNINLLLSWWYRNVIKAHPPEI